MSNIILHAEGLTKSFRGFVAVRDVDLSIQRKTVHALIGPNGAGKTTVFNLLTKFLEPTRGRIKFAGHDITHTGPADVARLGLVRSFQISAIFPHLSVLNNLRVALQRPNGLAVQFWRPMTDLTGLDDRAIELIEMVGLSAHVHTEAGDLSYGRKRALEIATTLALEPDLLLLDEPMAGMGSEDIDRIASLIREIGNDRTVLMVEHNLKVVANICDQVTVLQAGQVIAEGDYLAVSSDERVRDAYLGTEHE